MAADRPAGLGGDREILAADRDPAIGEILPDLVGDVEMGAQAEGPGGRGAGGESRAGQQAEAASSQVVLPSQRLRAGNRPWPCPSQSRQAASMSRSCWAAGSAGDAAPAPEPTSVTISKPRIRVRWTGHLSAISSSLASSSALERPFEGDVAGEEVARRRAVGAGRDDAVRGLDRERRQRPALALGIELQRHRGAGGERGGEQFIGRRAGAAAARPRPARRRGWCRRGPRSRPGTGPCPSAARSRRDRVLVCVAAPCDVLPADPTLAQAGHGVRPRSARYQHAALTNFAPTSKNYILHYSRQRKIGFSNEVANNSVRRSSAMLTRGRIPRREERHDHFRSRDPPCAMRRPASDPDPLPAAQGRFRADRGDQHHAAGRRDAGAADHVHHHHPGRQPQGAARSAAARSAGRRPPPPVHRLDIAAGGALAGTARRSPAAALAGAARGARRRSGPARRSTSTPTARPATSGSTRSSPRSAAPASPAWASSTTAASRSAF